MSVASGKVVTISICGGSLASYSPTTRSESQLTQLVEMLGDYSLPATWFLTDPGGNRWTAQIACSQPQNEIALDARAVWAASSTPDAVFEELLHCSIVATESAGLTARSFVVRDGLSFTRSEIAARQGLAVAQVVRGFGEPNFGHSLKVVGADLALPHNESIWSLVRDYQAARQVVAQFHHRRHCHVMIDLDTLAHHGTLGVDTIRRLVRSVAIQRERGILGVLPLCRLAPVAQPARRLAA